MTTVTLSPSGLMGSNLPSTCPSQLVPTRSSYRGRSSSLSRRFSFLHYNSFGFQWRTLCGWHKTGEEEHVGHYKCTVWHEPNDTEFRFYDCRSQHKIAEVANDCHKIRTSCLSASSLLTKDESRDAMKISASNSLIPQLLNSAILFGLLTFQGTEQALAASDFVNNFQSTNFFGDLGDISTGFASAFLLIFFSELGDKTFFIAALLAARNSAAVVFTGTFGALALMTIISVILGRTFHYIDGILPFSLGGNDLPIDDIAAVFLLVYFGVTTLIDATSADNQRAEDEQKEAEIAVSDFSGNGAGILAAASTVISTFVLVFVAEWGDKSFFSTIALAAASSPLGVIGGALAGHGVATLLAVAGGSLLGTFLSEKVIAYTGGILFLVFASITLIEIIRG